jgi:hypothetical protein
MVTIGQTRKRRRWLADLRSKQTKIDWQRKLKKRKIGERLNQALGEPLLKYSAAHPAYRAGTQ